MKVKYFTKGALIRANDEAIRTGRNRTLHPHLLEELPELRFPVGWSMIHNDCEIRCQITVGPSADQLQACWLDVPFGTFNALPEIGVPS
jgi:hypothetical protein